MWRWLTAALFVVVASCTAAGFGWEEVDYCGNDGCIRCTSHRDCVTASSCCADTLFCLHRDEHLATCDLWCEEPDPPPCRCERGRCRFQ